MGKPKTKIPLSELIAIFNWEHFIKKWKKERLKKELIEQCKETAKLNLEICDEFKYVDSENIS